MRTLSELILASITTISSPAMADSCASALAAPLPSEAGTFGFTMSTLDRNGIATYSRGSAGYLKSLNISGGPNLPPVPRPARWLTAATQPATLYRDIGKVVRNTPPQNPGDFFVKFASINVTAVANPTVTVRFLDTGATHTFAATCSASNVIHGTSEGIDMLIHLTRPMP